jgi:hypothetical protein
VERGVWEEEEAWKRSIPLEKLKAMMLKDTDVDREEFMGNLGLKRV